MTLKIFKLHQKSLEIKGQFSNRLETSGIVSACRGADGSDYIKQFCRLDVGIYVDCNIFLSLAPLPPSVMYCWLQDLFIGLFEDRRK